MQHRFWIIGVIAATSFGLASCGSGMTQTDDFPARLKRGCASRRECIVLAQNARTRLIECREYLVGGYVTGSKPIYRDHWRGCAYEEMDYRRAVELLLRWERSVRVVPVVKGEALGPIQTLTDGGRR